MATRNRKTWKPNKAGVFERQIGWKLSRTGKRVQHKFRFACTLKDALRREQKIVELWEGIEATTFGGEPQWCETTTDIAKQIATGKVPIQVRKDGDEDEVTYVKRVHELRKRFPTIAILPKMEYSHAFGLRMLEWIDDRTETARQAREEQSEQNAQSLWNHIEGGGEKGGPALHHTIDDYITWLKQEYQDGDQHVTPWGRTKIKQVETLKSRHDDISLASMDHETVGGMFRFWRQRPTRKGSTERIAKKSAEHYVAALKDFFRWLHVNPRYKWRKPEGFDDIRTRVRALESEQRRQVDRRDVFTLDELVLLNTYATPLERFLLLLGVNCGFGRAETATLLVGEVHLRQPHKERFQGALGFDFSSDDSFIKRHRRKTGVYGEHLLFPQTVEAVEWVLKRRRRLPKFGQNARLLLTDKAEPYDKLTKGGNPDQRVPNMLSRLIQRVRADGKEIRSLSFGKLRKTAGNLVRQFAGGEVAGVFLCHGQPVNSDNLLDVYTSRPFGKVFQATRQVEEYLQPMFEAAGPTPFASGRGRKANGAK